MKLKDAIRVAQAEWDRGVVDAVETLEALGYDCTYYWNHYTDYPYETNNEGRMIAQYRALEELYDKLQITNMIEKAKDTLREQK